MIARASVVFTVCARPVGSRRDCRTVTGIENVVTVSAWSDGPPRSRDGRYRGGSKPFAQRPTVVFLTGARRFRLPGTRMWNAISGTKTLFPFTAGGVTAVAVRIKMLIDFDGRSNSISGAVVESRECDKPRAIGLSATVRARYRDGVTRFQIRLYLRVRTERVSNPRPRRSG